MLDKFKYKIFEIRIPEKKTIYIYIEREREIERERDREREREREPNVTVLCEAVPDIKKYNLFNFGWQPF